MRSKTLVALVLMWIAVGDASLDAGVEARGKKKKIALFNLSRKYREVYFADLVIKKIFILKLIYAFVLWVVVHKAGYFLGWFVSYLKEKSHHHVEYSSPPDYHHHQEYDAPYGGYGPYRRKNNRR